MDLYQDIESKIREVVGHEQKIEFDSKFADIAIPCFTFDNPNEKAEEFAKELKNIDYFSSVETKGPFINIIINWPELSEDILKSVDQNYGANFKEGKGIVEHTSINPNASPHIGRCRNGIIGDSLVRLLRFSGIDVETHYYVNDTGKQIALLVWASQGKDIDFHELLDVYVEANKKMKEDKSIEQEVFDLLKKFQEGDEEVRERFRNVVSTALKGKTKLFSRLNIEFDEFDYESEIEESEELKEVMEKLEKSDKFFKDDKDRLVLDTTEVEDDTYLVLRRSNGTYLYGARDLGYSLHKSRLADGGVNIVVLGEGQKLYQRQIEYGMELAGFKSPEVVHYSFVSLKGEKMSTREGNLILLEDLLKDVNKRALEEIEKRYSDLGEEEKQKRVRAISTAAIRYGMIKVSPEKGLDFNPDQAVSFEGNTGPYLQYTYARARSIISKSEKNPKEGELEEGENELLKLISEFPNLVRKSTKERKPHVIADYVYNLANEFNAYYEKNRVIGSEKERERLALVDSVSIIIKNCLSILGIDALEEM